MQPVPELPWPHDLFAGRQPPARPDLRRPATFGVVRTLADDTHAAILKAFQLPDQAQHPTSLQ